MFNIKENKVVYQYDAEGVLVKAVVLDATDRADNGDWIYPTRTTPVVPPLSKKGYELVWKNGAWQYRKYIPKPLKTDEQIEKEEYESMQNECINNLNVAMLRNDEKAVASVRQDYADLQDYYGQE